MINGTCPVGYISSLISRSRSEKPCNSYSQSWNKPVTKLCHCVGSNRHNRGWQQESGAPFYSIWLPPSLDLHSTIIILVTTGDRHWPALSSQKRAICHSVIDFLYDFFLCDPLRSHQLLSHGICFDALPPYLFISGNSAARSPWIWTWVPLCQPLCRCRGLVKRCDKPAPGAKV